MSDLFHNDVPLSFIQKVFETMKEATQHKFQVLTKRAERLPEINNFLSWPDNVWLGVTVELEKYLNRIEQLKETDAKTKFISFEPLLGMINKINLEGIDWVIAGGESGPGARPMEKDWVRAIRDNCLEQNTPFFFKHWGGVSKKKNGRVLDGRTWDEYP
jgi:protein gp37